MEDTNGDSQDSETSSTSSWILINEPNNIETSEQQQQPIENLSSISKISQIDSESDSISIISETECLNYTSSEDEKFDSNNCSHFEDSEANLFKDLQINTSNDDNPENIDLNENEESNVENEYEESNIENIYSEIQHSLHEETTICYCFNSLINFNSLHIWPVITGISIVIFGIYICPYFSSQFDESTTILDEPVMGMGEHIDLFPVKNVYTDSVASYEEVNEESSSDLSEERKNSLRKQNNLPHSYKLKKEVNNKNVKKENFKKFDNKNLLKNKKNRAKGKGYNEKEIFDWKNQPVYELNENSDEKKLKWVKKVLEQKENFLLEKEKILKEWEKHLIEKEIKFQEFEYNMNKKYKKEKKFKKNEKKPKKFSKHQNQNEPKINEGIDQNSLKHSTNKTYLPEKNLNITSDSNTKQDFNYVEFQNFSKKFKTKLFYNIAESINNLSGEWYLDLLHGRQDFRKQKEKATWWFDRVQSRKNLRNKAYWYFQYMFNRENLRYKSKSMPDEQFRKKI